MKPHRFEALLGAVFLVLWLAVWLWQNPWARGERIGTQDAARYLAAIEQLPVPPAERAETLARARAWIDDDDGRPVYMLNLMRFFPELHRYPGAPEFNGTPRQSNELYEREVMPLLFKTGGYPVYAGSMQGRNLLEYGPALDDWNRLLVVRYPSRRAFLELLSDPAYAPIAPYKLMSLAVVLSPTSAEIAIPELPWLLGALLLTVFLAVGWWRTARRAV